MDQLTINLFGPPIFRHTFGMAKNTGKTAEQQVEDYFKSFGKQAHLYRFEDQADLVGRNNGKIVKSDKKPADYLLTHLGFTSYLEVKSSLSKTSFPLGNISDGQFAYALKISRAGGRYDFLIKNERTGHWYLVPFSYVEALTEQGRKSTKWTELEDDGLRFKALETI